MIAGLPTGEVIENGLGHSRSTFFGAEPIPSADVASRSRKRRSTLDKGREHVEVERLAERSGFFGAIQHLHRFHPRRKRGQKRFEMERQKQTNGQDPNFLAARSHPGGGFGERLDRAAHGDYYAFRLGMTLIFEQAIGSSGGSRETLHHFLHDAGQRVIEPIHRLATLKINIRILRRAPQRWAIRVIARARKAARSPSSITARS